MQSETDVVSLQKSTTDRSSWPELPGWVRASFRALSHVAPGRAARLAESLFLRTHRKPLPDRERRWTERVTRTTLRVAGRDIAAWSIGDGPTVLLVHGWGSRGSQLGAFVEPLIRRGYRVVGYDGPGHGASQGRRSSVPELADAVFAVGRDFGPLAGIVAHSLGTAATTIALHRGLVADRCVYVSPPARMSYFPEKFCRVLGFAPSIAERLRRRIERRFDVRFSTLEGPYLARRFAAPPLLIVHDRLDPDVPFEHGRELAEAWPGARFVATKGLGHRTVLRDETVVTRGVEFISAEAAARTAIPAAV